MEHAGPQPKHVVDDGAREEDAPGKLHVLEQLFIQDVQLVALTSQLMWSISEADDTEALRSADLEVGTLAKAHCELFGETQFPFDRFPGVDVILGPEMRSTGEVMGALWRWLLPEPPARLEPTMALPRTSSTS